MAGGDDGGGGDDVMVAAPVGEAGRQEAELTARCQPSSCQCSCRWQHSHGQLSSPLLGVNTHTH